MSVLDVICLGAALLVCLSPLLSLAAAALKGWPERLRQLAAAGRSRWRRLRLELAHPELRGAPALAAGAAEGAAWEIRAAMLETGGGAGLSVQVGPVETPLRSVTAGAQGGVSRVEELAILTAETAARLERFTGSGGWIAGGVIRRELAVPPTPEAAAAAQREVLPELLEIARRVRLRPEEVPERLSAALREGSAEDRLDRLRALIRGWPERLRAEGWERLAAMLEDESEEVRLEMALFLPDRDTLRYIFQSTRWVDRQKQALEGMDVDLFGSLVAEAFEEALALPDEDFWREMERVRLLRVRLLAEQVAARRYAEALPLLAPLLGRCLRREGPVSNRWNHIRLCESLFSAFAAVAPPGEASESAVLPFLDSREPVVELAAMRVLGMIGTGRSVPLLRTRVGVLIRDARGRIAAEAIAAIRQRIGGSGGGLMLAEGGGLMVAEGGGLALGGEGGRDG